MEASVDFEEYLIQLPLVARPRRLVAQVVSVSLTELKASFSDSLIVEEDTAHRWHLFDIAVAQGSENTTRRND
jgi:hypothetical protein